MIAVRQQRRSNAIHHGQLTAQPVEPRLSGRLRPPYTRCGRGSRRPAGGFTLLEVMVAVAIFALIATMAYGGLNSVIRQSEVVAQQTDRLLALQRGLARLRGDLQQALDRPRRDSRGTMTPAFIGANPGQSDELLHFTRLGQDNPWLAPRGQLARVQWRLAGQTLQRHVAAPVDGAAAPDDRDWQSVIRDVTAMELHFYDQENQAHPFWPPANQPDAGLPRAVEIMLHGRQTSAIRITTALVADWPAHPPGFDADADDADADNDKTAGP